MENFNARLSNEKIAPVIAQVSTARIPDLRQEFNQSSHGLSNHHFTHLFASYQGQWKLWDTDLLFRAQTQLSFYQQAFDATQKFLFASTKQNQNIDTYFKVITLWEASFVNFQTFINLYNSAFNENIFCKGDGCKGQRTYNIATTIERWTAHRNDLKHGAPHTTPLWLSNTGFHTDKLVVSYIEFSSLIRDISRTAEILQTPNAH